MTKKKPTIPSDRPRFVAPQAVLARLLRAANGVAKTTTAMPVLGFVRITAKNGDLTVQATDLNVSVTSRVKVSGNGTVDICAPCRDFERMMAKLEAGDVTVVDIEKGWIQVSGGNTVFRVAVMPGKDFPKCHEMPDESVEVDAAQLRSLIERTSYSVCNDETRFHLNGCLFEADGTHAWMTSTDGHRLSRARVPLTLEVAPTAGVIVSRTTLAVMAKMLESAERCRVVVNHPHIHVECGDTRIGAKLIDAQFPPYDQVIPKGRTDSVIVHREALAAAIDRVQLMSSETRGLKISHADGILSLHSDAPDRGDASDDVDATVNGDPVRAVGVAPRYIAESVGVMPGDRVRFMLAPATQGDAELAPVLVMPELSDDVMAVIMPMRI